MSDGIVIRWRELGEDDDPGWDQTQCLYAYVEPDTDEILYIGKAWGVSVRGRWVYSAKPMFWEYLKDQEIGEHVVVIGKIELPEGWTLTDELLADIESLLIIEEQPPGNVQSKRSRTAQPGLVLRCCGEWPGRQGRYEDPPER